MSVYCLTFLDSGLCLEGTAVEIFTMIWRSHWSGDSCETLSEFILLYSQFMFRFFGDCVTLDDSDLVGTCVSVFEKLKDRGVVDFQLKSS